MMAGFSANSGSLYQIPKSFRMNLAMKDVAMRFLAAMFSTAFISLSYGAECAHQGAKPNTSNDPDSIFEDGTPYPQYGVWIAPMARTKIECDAYGTPRSWADNPYDPYNRLWTEVLSDTASVAARNDTLPPPYYVDVRASAHAESTQNISISSQKIGYAHDLTAIAPTYGYAADTIWFEVDGADADSITTVLFKSCGEYSSKYNIYPYVQQSAYFRPLVYPVDDRSWSDPKKDTVAIDDGVKSATYFSSGEESYCVSGKLKIGGERAAYTFNSMASIIGTKSYERIDYNGKKITLDAWDGKLDIATSLDIPKGVKCYSASVQFPGCELRKDEAFDLKVTQAIFDDSAEIKLVFGRTTAIILKRKIPWSHVFDLQIVEAGGIAPVFETNTGGSAFQKIDDETNNSYELVFYCNQLNEYCNLKKDKKYTISLRRRDVELAAKNVHVEETLPSFVLPLVVVIGQVCGSSGCYTSSPSVDDLNRIHSSGSAFVRDVFPIPDSALRTPVDLSIKYAGFKGYVERNTPCGSVQFAHEDLIEIASESLRKAKEKYPDARKAAVVLSSEYFHRLARVSGIYGFKYPEIKDVVFVRDVAPAHGLAHETTHVYGLGEEYTTIPDNACELDSRGINVKGFNVFQKEYVNGISYMGAPLPTGLADEREEWKSVPWITNRNWHYLFQEIKNPKDPELLFISGIIGRDGAVLIKRLNELNGIPNESSEGSYSIRLTNAFGGLVSEYKFSLDLDKSFEWEVEPGQIVDLPSVGLIKAIRYPPDTARMEIVDPDDKVLFSTDPATFVLNVIFEDVPDSCMIEFGENTRGEIDSSVRNLNVSIGALDKQGIKQSLAFFKSFSESRLSQDCDLSGTGYVSYEKMKGELYRTINRIAARHDVVL